MKSFVRFLIDKFVRPIYFIVVRKLAVRKNVFYHRDLHVGRRACIMAPNRLEIGRNVNIGMDTWIAVNGIIEDGVRISSYVGIVGKHDHGIGVVGQRPYNAPWVFDGSLASDERHSVHIERDVWIGYKATILSGVKIHRGAVIAAAAVVTKDVPPYAIMAGSPARQVGSLFTEKQIIAHESMISS